MDLFLLGFCSVVILILLYLIYRVYNRRKNKKNGNRLKNNSVNRIAKKTVKSENAVSCPVCGMNLSKGENLISKIYRPMNVPDQYMTISGCPHCYPHCENGLNRICPVCRKTMKQNDFLTARLFNKSEGKKHVHIAGCSNCHKTKFD